MEIDIGKRINELRKQKKLSLLEVSEKSGVALATISRIENGKMTGTLDSHIAIARALDITLPELYTAMNEPVTAQQAVEHSDVFVYNEKTSSVILTKDILSKKMLPVLLKISEGGRTNKEEMRKGTETFIYVLAGKLEVVVGKEHNILEKGATLYFDASLPYFMRNMGKGEAQCICITTPVTL